LWLGQHVVRRKEAAIMNNMMMVMMINVVEQGDECFPCLIIMFHSFPHSDGLNFELCVW
jgi:hypothetical protein